VTRVWYSGIGAEAGTPWVVCEDGGEPTFAAWFEIQGVCWGSYEAGGFKMGGGPRAILVTDGAVTHGKEARADVAQSRKDPDAP
jgi:hypothetical protein